MVVRMRWKPGSAKGKRPARSPEPPRPLTRQEVEGGVGAILSPVAALLFAISLWRLGQDLGLARNFFIEDGALSHWQPWFGLSACVAMVSARLNRRSQGGGDNNPAAG
ncbi:MAG: hypothetical protein KatS3mg004_3694 [Bryobacteraceae bacterium]|nr:MAG: hypothetical protein KatS3mg004_3694 [Bryobacteraceae bacterium]